MSIEEKLSAIKAINEEKDYVDKKLHHLVMLSHASATGITLHIDHPLEKGSALDAEAKRMSSFDLLPAPAIARVKEVINDYYTKRRIELIAKAEALMK